ncbi:AlpA family phage regulatory protein [Cohaesibacter sp. CAU 1516]|uniref:helix-turn-helix transcriptional regulator n=1 Tax=Cohaesibacter sp. CAU 1516 TaxID=2576038 RepID=UPI0010FD12F2|nr:AlpA family phage regulatory protein [Cohaesibacter sp. CAU 1516]TLP45432.1 AlpA family phage regulatory protein [Cohaesibacter sp. CAU 1516]
MDQSNSPADRLLAIKDVCRILNRSPASIYRDIARGDFPRPIKLGGSSRWRLSTVNDVMVNGISRDK